MENERDIDTLLIEAAKEGNLGAVEFLVEKGSDVNAKREDGKTALSLAKEYKNYDYNYTAIVEFLIAHGAREWYSVSFAREISV